MNYSCSKAILSDIQELRGEIDRALKSAEVSRVELTRQNEELSCEISRLNQIIQELRTTGRRSQTGFDASKRELDIRIRELTNAQGQNRSLVEKIDRLSNVYEMLAIDNVAYVNKKDKLASYISELESNLRKVTNSQSWKVTSILRRVNVLAQRLLLRRRVESGFEYASRPDEIDHLLRSKWGKGSKGLSIERSLGIVGLSDVQFPSEAAESISGVRAGYEEFKPFLDLPTKIHGLRKSRFMPRFERLRAERELPSGYSFELALPKPPGNKNDYQFLIEAAHQSYCGNTFPTVKLSVVVWVRSLEILTELEKAVHCQSLDRSQFRLTLFIENGLSDALTPWADRVLKGRPWKLKEETQFECFADDSDLLLFLDGTLYPDPQLFERAVRYSAVSSNVVLALTGVPQDTAGFDNVYSDAKVSHEWRNARFPFRNFQTLNFLFHSSRFKSLGGFNPELNDIRKAGMELAFRAYNKGAYFIPLGASRNDRVTAQYLRLSKEQNQQDADLFRQLCPVHWYRPDDGVYKVPKVSIYIPAYNAAKYLSEAIDSVLQQDFQDLEVCVHVDGATDDTLQVLESAYADDDRVRWSVDENAGIGHASNRAIELTRGLYVGQLDSDDRLKPGAIRALADFLDQNADTGCVYSSCERVDGNGQFLGNEYSWPHFSHEKMMLTSIVHHFRLFRRQVWERTEKFRETIKNAVDYDMFLKISEVTNLHHIDQMYYQRRWHGDNTSNINEDLQTQNTYLVQSLSLERQGLNNGWKVGVPDPDHYRKISYETTADRKRVFFWPDYTIANPYQRLLYQQSVQHCEICAGDIDAAIKAAFAAPDPENLVFHIHWLNPLMEGAESALDLRERLNEFLAKIKQFQSMGGKVIWTIHNVVSHDSNNVYVEVEFSQKLAAVVDRIHLHSQSSIADIEKTFSIPRDKIFISRHGVYKDIYPNYVSSEISRHHFGIDEDDIVVLAFGQIRPYKGLENLIEVCERLFDEGYPVKLIIAGSAGYDIRLANAEMNLTFRRTKLIERRIDDSEIQLLFNSADVAVFPYRRILTSGSLMLSLSFGVPAVVPSVGMTQEVLRDKQAGFLYGEGEECVSLEMALRQILELIEQGLWCDYRDRVFALAREWEWPDFSDVLVNL